MSQSLRLARDGQPYAHTAFVEHYGQEVGDRIWSSAVPYTADQGGSAPQPAGPAAADAPAEPTPSADQGGGAPQPAGPTAADAPAEPTPDLPQTAVCLTFDQLQALPRQPGMGGKAACQKQRELR